MYTSMLSDSSPLPSFIKFSEASRQYTIATDASTLPDIYTIELIGHLNDPNSQIIKMLWIFAVVLAETVNYTIPYTAN